MNVSGKKVIHSRREFLQNCSALVSSTAATIATPVASIPSVSLTEGREVVSPVGAIAAAPRQAAQVGARILAAGGNAVDALAAACLAACAVQERSAGIGGYVCAAVVREGKTGRIWSLDANAVAPAGAQERMYEVLPPVAGKAGVNEREYSCSVKDDANVYGPLAIATPGVMGGIGVLSERWGQLKWPAIVEPALELLDKGFPYGTNASAIEELYPIIRKFEPSAKHLLLNGKIPKAGESWRKPDLQKTLTRLVRAGWRDFYEGELGGKIADYVGRIGGILSREDMAKFQPRVTEPYEIAYRNAKIYGASLPNGGLSSLQMLKMLECLDLAERESVQYWHRWAEILKLGWRDRLDFLGDPDFVKVPVQKLLSREYACERIEGIRRNPDAVAHTGSLQALTSAHGTIHLSAADKDGNIAAVTISHGGAFGSCVTVPGTGILLGHGMSRFDPRPGRANSVGARKRPLNNVAPSIAVTADRILATGMSGGRRIVSVNAQALHRFIDYGLTSYPNATAPRMHVEAKEPLEITHSAGGRVVEGLSKMGHGVTVVSSVGNAIHSAEILQREGKLRAGGNVWAAGT